jgi:hypothetical protein
MKSKAQLALIRFAKVLAAGALASASAFVVSPAFLDIVGTQTAVFLVPILTSIFSGLEKGYLKQTS